jgi:hypothetical protein
MENMDFGISPDAVVDAGSQLHVEDADLISLALIHMLIGGFQVGVLGLEISDLEVLLLHLQTHLFLFILEIFAGLQVVMLDMLELLDLCILVS